jgi:hypothetical protein
MLSVPNGAPEHLHSQAKQKHLHPTGWKNNLAPMTVIPRQIDHSHPANALVISDEALHFSNTPASGVRSPALAQTVMKFISP